MTAVEWRNVLLADAAMALVALAAAVWLVRHRLRGTALVAALSLVAPPALALYGLRGELGEPTDCTLICWNAYETHWIGFVAGCVVGGALLLPALVVISVRKLRRWRSARAAGVLTG